MTNTEEVRYELMRPAELVRRRNAFPLAYLPLGTIEWHGMHNPVGLDGIKAQELCIRAAGKTGGLVFPVSWYGEIRESHLAEANPPVKNAVAEAMNLPPQNFDRGYMGGATISEQARLYQDLVFHIYYQIRSLGFEAIYVVVGHGPMLHWAVAAGQLFERETKIKVEAEHTGAMVPAFKEGHAGRIETGLMLALRPELVDMSRLPTGDTSKLEAIDGLDPRHGSAETGRSCLKALLDHMVERAENLMRRPTYDGSMRINAEPIEP